MIPYTYPAKNKNNINHCIVYPLSSITGLKSWIDYIPVKKVTGATRNCFENVGSQSVNELSVITDFQPWLDYIPVYYDNSLTKPWSTDIGGYIPVSSDAYGYNMTSAGDYFSCPDSVATSITGDLTLVVEAALTDWTPFISNVLVAKDNATTQRSYTLAVLNTGHLRFIYSLNGVLSYGVSSTAIPSFTNGKKYHVAVEREATTGKIRFYTSNDGESFTQLGSEIAGTAGALFDGTTPVEFGNLSVLAYALVGSIFDSEGYAGLAITNESAAELKFSFDPFDWVSGSSFVSSETGETWTLNGNAAIYK